MEAGITLASIFSLESGTKVHLMADRAVAQLVE